MSLSARRVSAARRALHVWTVASMLFASGCSAVSGLVKQYEYDETIDLSLDGSATVYVNGSVPALIALRGLDLDPTPRARVDRARIRDLYAAPGVAVQRISVSRRNARQFLHIRLDVADIRQLSLVQPLSWSHYELRDTGGEYMFRQRIEGSARRPVPRVQWTGRERVAFRVHLPSRVRFHNAGADNLKRGNIIEWEGMLSDRLAGAPVRFEARMDTQSILHRTLWMFALTFLAAVSTLAIIVWFVMRGGRRPAWVARGPERV